MFILFTRRLSTAGYYQVVRQIILSNALQLVLNQILLLKSLLKWGGMAKIERKKFLGKNWECHPERGEIQQNVKQFKRQTFYFLGPLWQSPKVQCYKYRCMIESAASRCRLCGQVWMISSRYNKIPILKGFLSQYIIFYYLKNLIIDKNNGNVFFTVPYIRLELKNNQCSPQGRRSSPLYLKERWAGSMQKASGKGQ